LDLHLPPMLLSGMAAVQLLLLAAELFEAPLALQVIVAAALSLGSLSYLRVEGPAWLPTLQSTAMCIPLWARLSESLPLPPDQVRIVRCAGFMALGLLATGHCLCACRLARTARKAAALEAGVEQLFRNLGRKGAILCQSGEAGAVAAEVAHAGRSDSSACLAASLEAFEAQIRFERLDQAFLQGRAQWLQDLRNGRHSFDLVAHSAQRLLAAVQTPPDSMLVVAALKASGPAARRVPAPIWAIIMKAVGGAYPLEELLQPVTEEFARGSPGRQLFRAQAAMEWCLSAQRKLRRMLAAEAGTSPSEVVATLEHEVAMFRQSMPQLYGRGCACGRSLKPADNCSLFKHQHRNKCCKYCDAGTRGGSGAHHSGDCERRARKSGTGALWSLSQIALHLASPQAVIPDS